MKISYISSSTIPSKAANVVHVMKMSNALAESFLDVDLYIHVSEPSFDLQKVYELYSVSDKVNIRHINFRPYRSSHLLYAFMAVKDAKKRNSDVIYTRSLFAAFYCHCFSIPFVYESHAPDEGRNSSLKNWIFKKTIFSQHLLKFVVITHSLCNYYSSKYPDIADNTFVAPDASDEISKDVKPIHLRKDNAQMNVGYIGHLYKGKGMEVIVNVIEKCPWAHFHIVGGTNEDICYWKKKLESLDNFTFHGFVSHEETKSYLLAFDVVLAPLQKKISVHGGGGDIGKWTSPLKIFEYMSAGLPIVASDLEVLKEVLRDRENSILVEHDNIEEWCNILFFLKNNVQLRNEIGQRALHEFKQKYTWNQRIKNILNACDIEVA